MNEPSFMNNNPAAPDSDSVPAAVPTGPESDPAAPSQQDTFQLNLSEVPQQLQWSWRHPRVRRPLAHTLPCCSCSALTQVVLPVQSWDLHLPHGDQQESVLADVLWAPPTAPTGGAETSTDGEWVKHAPLTIPFWLKCLYMFATTAFFFSFSSSRTVK